MVCARRFFSFILSAAVLVEVLRSDEILVADADDDKLVVDEQQGPSAEETKLPNSHSAALVMAFILLCLVSYGLYRLCKWKCCKEGRPLSVTFGSGNKGDLQGMEDFLKEREAYLEIYGQRKSVSTISGFVSKAEPVETAVVIPVPNTDNTRKQTGS